MTQYLQIQHLLQTHFWMRARRPKKGHLKFNSPPVMNHNLVDLIKKERTGPALVDFTH